MSEITEVIPEAVDGVTAAFPGASDQDRKAWLAERRQGVTATEVRDLYLGKVSARQLALQKLGRVQDSFTGNAFTRWGQEREPVIANRLTLAFDFKPEHRVWHHRQNPRFLASPDGMAISWDDHLWLAEIKTSGKDKTLFSDGFTEAGYLAQMVWQMFVMGAEQCLYAWEWRLGSPGNFTPGELVLSYLDGNGADSYAWVVLDKHLNLLSELETLAREFLATLDQLALEPFETPEVDEEVDTLAVNYLVALDAEKTAKEAKEKAYGELLARVGGDTEFVQESPLARVSFTPGRDKREYVVDEDAARALYPFAWQAFQDAQQEWAECTKTLQVEQVSHGRDTLRVTRGEGVK